MNQKLGVSKIATRATLTIEPANVVCSGVAAQRSRVETFNLGDTQTERRCLGGGIRVDGVTQLPITPLDELHVLYIKVHSGDLVINITSASGTDQAFPISRDGQLLISGTVITNVTVDGEGTLNFEAAGF